MRGVDWLSNPDCEFAGTVRRSSYQMRWGHRAVDAPDLDGVAEAGVSIACMHVGGQGLST